MTRRDPVGACTRCAEPTTSSRKKYCSQCERENFAERNRQSVAKSHRIHGRKQTEKVAAAIARIPNPEPTGNTWIKNQPLRLSGFHKASGRIEPSALRVAVHSARRS